MYVLDLLRCSCHSYRLSAILSLGIILIAVSRFPTSSGIAIRPFKHKTTVNGLNCSTETAFATLGCFCRLNGQHCLGNLKCVSNVCICPPAFITVNGVCVPGNFIYINCTNNNNPGVNSPFGYGWPNCIPSIGSVVPGATIQGNKPEACKATVITSVTPPIDVTAYDDTDNTVYIAVDPNTGQLYLPGPGVPFGPGLANTVSMAPEPLVITYAIQCIDSRGVNSNTLVVNITYPSFDTVAACNLDGSIG